MRSLSKVCENLILRIIDEKLKRKHAASINPLIRAVLDMEDKGTYSFILERNLFYFLCRRMFDTKGLVIYKAKPPAIGKSFVRERDICLGDLNKLRTFFD
jgi:hypothetical protein